MAIDIRDYSRTAAQRGWGAGWPSCAGARAAGTAVVTADRSGVRVSVHKRLARLVDLLMDETERRGYLLRIGQCGGYNCRPISGTQSASNHSWGLALDINWQINPYAQPRRTDMPGWMPLLWNRYGFAWGGNYGRDGTTGKADAMHYEFMGSPAQADEMTALALRELGGAPGAPAPVAVPAPSRSADDMQNFTWPAGGGSYKLICPTGKASGITARAWLSLACDGEITEYGVWFQGDSGGIADHHGTVAKDRRQWWELPDGTTQIVIHYTATGPVAALLETTAKR